jgi:hypothetical protein
MGGGAAQALQLVGDPGLLAPGHGLA